MKKNYLFMKTKNIYILLLIMIVAVFTSCEKESDKDDSGVAVFKFTDAAEQISPTGYNVGFAGNAAGQQYVIRSNRSWKIVAKSEGSWVKFFPNEGDDDGIVKVIVNENTTFTDRQMQYAFVVDGEEEPVLFTVNQAKATPILTISDITGKNLNQTAQTFTINVKANVAYTYTSDASWLVFQSSSKGSTSTDLTFSVTANEGSTTRTGNIAFVCNEFPSLNASLIVKQEGKSEGTIVLFENFSWLTYGSPIFYTTTNETRYDAWTAAEIAKGWTSTVNTASGSGNTPLLYARTGFIKLGKTGYGGDLISPKLPITGTKNLLVKFKAVPYMTATGTKDDNTLVVSLIGPGTISKASFIIDNWPNYTSDPNCTAIWEDKATERSFTITGATSDTQIKFVGGDYNLVGVGAGKNRIFLDDIKVIIPN